MATHLYKKFLVSKNEYDSNVDFWETIISAVLSPENIAFEHYVSTSKKDGTLYRDGNPIYNFRINNSNRAVRIIQEEIETEDVEFSAWINDLELEGETIEELVISLELSHESALLAIELINAWIVNSFSRSKTQAHIDKIYTLKEMIFHTDITNKKSLAV